MSGSLRWIAAAWPYPIAVVGFAVLGQQSPTVVRGRPFADRHRHRSHPSPSPSPAWDSMTIDSDAARRVAAVPSRPDVHLDRVEAGVTLHAQRARWVNVRDCAESCQFDAGHPDNRSAAAGEYASVIRSSPLARHGPTERTVRRRVGRGPRSRCDAAKFDRYLATLENVGSTRADPVTIGGLTGMQIDLALELGDGAGCLPSAPIGRERHGIRATSLPVVLDRPSGSSLIVRHRRFPSTTTRVPFARKPMPHRRSRFGRSTLTQGPSPSRVDLPGRRLVSSTLRASV